ATGLPDYLIYAYYFYQKDTQNMTNEQANKYRNQKFQEVVFNLNQPYLKSGIQSAYTNFSILDIDHIATFFGEEKYPDGSDILSHLGEILQFQQDFLNYIGELRKEKWHTFPVISASLIFKDDKYTDEETAKMVVEHNWKYGFNDVNIMNVEEVTSLASCCRLVSNKKELKDKTFNSIGGSDINVGSSKVVTLNLVRLALLSKDEDEFIKLVADKTKLIHKYHFAHRNTLKKLTKKGLLPLYSYGMMSLDNQFATVGINGVFEAMKVLGGISKDEQGYYYNEKGFEIAKKMFNTISNLNDMTMNEYGYMSNTEQIPAESSAIKLNKKDRIYFGNKYINDKLGSNCYIYGNQWIPLKEETSIWHRIDTGKLDSYCGGGAILHINLGENFNTFEDAWNFTIGLAKKGVKYFSYISLINICENDHSFFGDICPICGKPFVTQGIKIVGYLVKQNSYKKERKQELKERKFYNIK
ncbi:MAG TPA: anaerobic ribonucleoside-triphosphate reductase, partial [Bacteroidales bacterium]|nr:anaerobic ribonucleoside-triphosphate reductase [Bacteroidales bacterium]